jgi:hypothetical protein
MNYNLPQNYETFLIGEIELKKIIKNLPLKSQKYISTIGYLDEYDENSDKGKISYKNENLNVNFSRTVNRIKLYNKNEVYMIYGFLQKNNNVNEDVVLYCNFYRILTNFNYEEFIKFLNQKREIMKMCQELNDFNLFWYDNTDKKK